MDKQKNMGECYEAIMKLNGFNEFKELAREQHIIIKNIKANSLPEISFPGLLIICKPGGRITPLINAYVDFLQASKTIPFCGTVSTFEFKLHYIVPQLFFSELTRLHNAITSYAGHNRFYKGAICIHIDEWSEHVNEPHFTKLMEYISGNKNLLPIFCIHTDNKNLIESVKAALTNHIFLETLHLSPPNIDELVKIVETKYIQNKGLSITENALLKIRETIEGIYSSKHYTGSKSDMPFFEGIVYNALKTELYDAGIITEKMLSQYGKDSEYVKNARTQINFERKIGFGEEYAR